MKFRPPTIIDKLDELLSASIHEGFVFTTNCWPDYTDVHFGKAARVSSEGRYTVSERFEASMSDAEIEAKFEAMKRKAAG